MVHFESNINTDMNWLWNITVDFQITDFYQTVY